MILELVTFKASPKSDVSDFGHLTTRPNAGTPALGGADWDAILADARATIPRWRANPALVRKHYLLSEDGEECAGLYVWLTRAAAEMAHDAAWRAGVEKRTGQAPVIRYFQLQMLLDNEAGTVTEWSNDGIGQVRPAG